MYLNYDVMYLNYNVVMYLNYNVMYVMYLNYNVAKRVLTT